MSPLAILTQHKARGRFDNDFFNLIDFIMDSLLGGTAYATDGSSTGGGHDYIAEFFDDPRITAFVDGITQWINDLPSTIMDQVRGSAISVVDFITNLFTVDFGSIQEWVQSNIIQPLIDAVTWGIENTPVLGDIAKLLGLGEDPETEAHDKGQSVGDSFNVGISTGLSGVDQIIHGAFEGLGIDDLTSQFMSNASQITSTATSTASNVAGSFSTMKNNQKSSLDTMTANNSNAFTDMQIKSNQKMVAMRDSTSQVTQQMTSAWTVMKDSILASAKKIRDDSKQRFDDLGTTIGGFYRKIQNPSLWGSGSSSLRSGSPTGSSRRVGRAVFGHGAGASTYRGAKTMSIGSLKNKLCPNGDCQGIFDGYNPSDVVDVNKYLFCKYVK